LALNIGHARIEIGPLLSKGLGRENGALARQFLVGLAQILFLGGDLLLIGGTLFFDLGTDRNRRGRFAKDALEIDNGDGRRRNLLSRGGTATASNIQATTMSMRGMVSMDIG